jgi:MOSC domain-containing protein YiiM
MHPLVVSVSRSLVHSFSKEVAGEITLLAGLGVEGDAHAGATVRHRYRVRKDPTAPNLCQVHLLHEELFAELAGKGIHVAAGEMGENVTTRGVDLLQLPVAARIHLGEKAIVEVTGLRDPCAQMNGLRPGLMKACIARDASGEISRKAGIMGVVLAGGIVRAGDVIRVEMPAKPWRKMGTV